MNLVDSSGWLEYFSNGENADFFAPVIEDTRNLIISTINIYEVFKKMLLEKGEDSALKAISAMHSAIIYPVDDSIALYAAKLSHDMKMHMADSIILAIAQLNNALLWTQDSDFEKIKDIKYIKRKDTR